MNFTDDDRKELKKVLNTLFEHGFSAALNASYFDEETEFWYGLDESIEAWEKQNRDLLNELGITIANGVTKVCLLFDDNYDWVVKMNAIDWENETDYCGIELHNYQEAVNAGLQYYFAEEIYFDTFKSEDDIINVYIQQYAAQDVDRIEEVFFEYAEENYGDRYEEVYENSDRLEAVFGEPRLITFCFEHNINDLHEANYGFLENGDCVIIDYSGY